MKSDLSDITIGFLLIGGSHHILHLIPPASELAKAPHVKVIIYVRHQSEKIICERVLRDLGLETHDVRVLTANPFLKALSPKLSVLFGNIGRLKALDALVVAERTSTILLVAGDKDKARMIEKQIVRDDNCFVTGYIKPFTVRRLSVELPKLFPTDQPIVLYNPHFHKTLSSWPEYGSELLEYSEPKPCVFIGPETTSWQDNPDYAHWQYGQVCHSQNAVIDALETAFSDHERYKAVQIKGSRAAMGDPDWNPVIRAADRILSILRG